MCCCRSTSTPTVARTSPPPSTSDRRCPTTWSRTRCAPSSTNTSASATTSKASPTTRSPSWCSPTSSPPTATAPDTQAAPYDRAGMPEPPLIRHLPPRGAGGADPDAVLDGFHGYAAELGLELYPAQEEAIYDIV